MIILVTPDGWLRFGGRRYRCALGKGGVRLDKREGDGATPVGRFRLVAAYYRADRIGCIATQLPKRAIGKRDGWCDEPGHRFYNRAITRPFRASHEALWRQDGLYDIVVEIDHNAHPPRRGMGSAIFIHVAAPGYAATEGCVGLAKKDLRHLIRRWTSSTRLCVAVDG